jgi:hypothetical protein
MRRALATDVADVRDALPVDGALVEYVAYRAYTGHLGFEPWYGAVVLTRDGQNRWVPLGAAAEIEARVRLDQKYMRRHVRDAALAEVLRGLYDSLCAPVLAALPEGIHRLVISPDGDLDFISFATLLDDNERFLADDFEIGYVASGRDLLRPADHPPRSRKLVVFAGHRARGRFSLAGGKARGMRRGDLSRRGGIEGEPRGAGFALRPAPGDARALSLRG